MATEKDIDNILFLNGIEVGLSRDKSKWLNVNKMKNLGHPKISPNWLHWWRRIKRNTEYYIDGPGLIDSQRIIPKLFSLVEHKEKTISWPNSRFSFFVSIPVAPT